MWATVGCATQVVWAGCAMLLLLLCSAINCFALPCCAVPHCRIRELGRRRALSNHSHQRRIVELKRQTSFDQLERTGDGGLMLVQGRTTSSKVGSGTSRTGASTSRSGSTTRKQVPCRVLRTMATSERLRWTQEPCTRVPWRLLPRHDTDVSSLCSEPRIAHEQSPRRNRRVLGSK